MEKIRLSVLSLACWFFLPGVSWAEEFLYLPITRTPVITAGFCGYRTASGACHGGIDYDVRDDGDGIFAAAEGVVEIAENGWGNTYRGRRVYGNYVQIRHANGYRTVYGHLKIGTLEVSVGDEVRAGERLGIGDNSGWSTGSHLHFEVRDSSGHKVDPYGESPSYPNCGDNSLWVVCPPAPPDTDEDADTWTVAESDCDDTNPDIYPGAVEHCNGLDDNCVDGVDEEPAASFSCRDSVDCTVDFCTTDTHVCSRREDHTACEDGDPCTTNLCIILTGCRTIPKDADLDGFTDVACGGDDCDDSNMFVRPDATERCDGYDNECDGETDEDWRTGLSSDLGGYCEVGIGMCRNGGVYVCRTDGIGTVCGAEPLPAGVEYCNEVDDDCDGRGDVGCIPEPTFNYCCDGHSTITGPADYLCVQLPGAYVSHLWVDWDDHTCDLLGASYMIPIGGTCNTPGYDGLCALRNFYGVCDWRCTSHASFCLEDRYRNYCTKQCFSDLDCPSPLTCQTTDTIRGGTVRLCREVY